MSSNYFILLIIYTHCQEKFCYDRPCRRPNSVLIILHGRIFHRLVPGSVHFKHIVPIPGSHSYRDTAAITKLYSEMRANYINTSSWTHCILNSAVLGWIPKCTSSLWLPLTRSLVYVWRGKESEKRQNMIKAFDFWKSVWSCQHIIRHLSRILKGTHIQEGSRSLKLHSKAFSMT